MNLEKKLMYQGRQLIPSSNRCSRCHQVEILSLSERIYRCNHCRLVIDRDLNAAINLEQLSTASSAGI